MYEWLQPAWQALVQSRQRQRLAHALLLSGPAGIGKSVFATGLAAALLCQQPRESGLACGECPACRLFSAGTHPDFFPLGPEETGKPIRVDPVRALCQELAMTSHRAGYKVALINPADALNVNAANSLLKTLEEPTDNTLIILVTDRPGRLPATIRSRCQQQRLPLPSSALAERWLTERVGEGADPHALLALAGGAPLLALQMHESGALEKTQHWVQQLEGIALQTQDPLSVAGEWSRLPEADHLRWFQRWLQGLLRWRQAGVAQRLCAPSDGLQVLLDKVDCGAMHEQLDRLADALNQWSGGLNRQLLVEAVLIGWSDLCRPAG